jgi:predicted RNA-binding Zn ribbon-like protein
MLQDPGGREPAPAPLREVQLFVNSVDTENVIEELDTPEALRDRLASRGLLDPDARVTVAELERAIEVREALRALLLGNNGIDVPPGATRTLEQASEAAHLVVRFRDAGKAELMPSVGGVDGALGRLVAIAFTAMADGSWRRLKACRREICQWAFYDRSRNNSSTWCSMSVCGNRTKTRAYRRRHA